MDLFARTFLPAAADAGLPMPTIGRHLALFRRCVGATNAVLAVGRCLRADRPLAGQHLLVLSRDRLVVTHESRVVHRIRLHLNAPVEELSGISWRRATRGSLEFAATAIDGVRERFLIQARHPLAVALLEATFNDVFHRRGLAPAA
jgi:hypothetical protein